MTIRISRRRFLSTTAAASAGVIAMPYLSRAADRPADHPWRAIRRRRPRWRRGVGARGPAVADGGRGRDHRIVWQCARAAADRSTAGERLHRKNAAGKPARRARTSSIASASATSPIPTLPSEPVVGRFRTAPADRRDVNFVWGGDVAGQGWGINPDDGGMFTFATMRKHRPDFFLHSGDTHLCRRTDQARSEACRRQGMEERHDPGKGEGRRDARRIPRRAQIQFPRRQSARLQCRGADLRAVGRP